MPRKYDDATRNKVAKLHDNLKTVNQIAEITGIPKGSVHKMVTEHNKKKGTPYGRGTQHGVTLGEAPWEKKAREQQ